MLRRGKEASGGYKEIWKDSFKRRVGILKLCRSRIQIMKKDRIKQSEAIKVLKEKYKAIETIK